MNAIEVQNLYHSYVRDEEEGSHLVLNDLSFSIKQGEYVSFIGHNGSGKSTLMKLIIGLLEKSAGKILIFGQELTEKNVDELRKHIGIVFQNPDNQFIGATVRDDIAFGLENRCIPHQDMDPLILEYSKKVGMDEYLDKEPSNLSGGQKQRVAIAGALSMHPDILLMDEATAMLDPKGRKEIVELTHRMRKENPNMTIVSVTHHMDEAALSDRIIVINEGKLLLDGTPSEIFKHEEELYKVGLDIPFNYKLRLELKELYPLIELNDSDEEVYSKICQ